MSKDEELFSLIFTLFSAQIENYMRVLSKAINEILNEKNSIEYVLIMFQIRMSNNLSLNLESFLWIKQQSIEISTINIKMSLAVSLKNKDKNIKLYKHQNGICMK